MLDIVWVREFQYGVRLVVIGGSLQRADEVNILRKKLYSLWYREDRAIRWSPLHLKNYKVMGNPVFCNV